MGLQSFHGKLVIIVGANLFGCAVAKIIREHGRPVVLVDTNNTFIDHARYLGFEAVHGNALEEEVLVQAGAEDAETMIAITSNSELNVLAAQLARNTFGIVRSFPVLGNPEKGAGMALLKRTGGRLAFGRPVDIVTWEYLANRNAAQTVWEVPAGWPARMVAELQLPENLLPVIRIRNKSAEIVNAEQAWSPGDTIVFLASEKHEDSLYQMEDLEGLLKSQEDIR
jgi:Trk K+ transport system NAD-binding subunit